MAIWMDRRTSTYTHMGGEGVPWIGQAPFTSEKHIFANLGDGTYYHSGSLAIRAAVAAKVNITYKILYNDAVAMTGGQPVDGPISPAEIAQLCAAEGVRKVVVVSDEPGKYPAGYFPPDVTIHHRDELDAVQRMLRETEGCTILLYDQTCAAEKRRRRKRGKLCRSGEARRHQRARLRRLRRLRRQVELRVGGAGRDRVRPQAHDRPELVQQGLFLRQRLLPELRHRRRRQLAQAAEGGSRRRPRPARARPRCDHRTVRHRRDRHRRHRRGHDRRAPRHGRASRRQGRHGARHDRPRAEERRRRLARAHRRRRPRPSTRPASPPATPS